MPRVILWADYDPRPVSIPFQNPDGTAGELTNHRLYCKVIAGRDPKDHHAIVDTGAPSMIFPLLVWLRFPDQITWLTFPDGASMKAGVVGGKAFSFKLGRIAVQLAGRQNEPRLPAVEVVAQFEQLDAGRSREGRLTDVVVGMQFGPLEGRFLIVAPRVAHPERGEAWVTDESPGDPLACPSD